MSATIRWLSLRMVEAFHAESLARFGGATGVRDPGLLESALARRVNAHAYTPDASVFDLAALYSIGIIKNHPFVDGNKRTGLLAGRVFLALNSYRFAPDELQAVMMIVGAAAGEIDVSGLAKWFADNSTPK